MCFKKCVEYTFSNKEAEVDEMADWKLIYNNTLFYLYARKG